MQNTRTNPPPSQLRVALIGKPGTRKTTIGLHFALFEALRGKGLYIADLDGNMTTALGLFESNYPNYTFLHEGKSHQINIFHTDFVRVAQEENKKLNKSSAGFSNQFILDRLYSELDEVKKNDAIGAILIDSQTMLNGVITDTLTNGGALAMQIQHWGQFIEKLQRFIFSVRATNKIVIWTAHEYPKYRDVRNASGAVIGQELEEFKINIPGKSADSFSSFFSDTWAFEFLVKNNKPEWFMTTLQTPLQDYVKNSLGLPPEIELPNEYGNIFTTLWGYVGARYPKS